MGFISIHKKLKPPIKQKAFTDNHVAFHTHSSTKLESILCHKQKKEKMARKGVYSLNCSCDPKKVYIGQTRVNIATRMKQHKADVESKNLD